MVSQTSNREFHSRTTIIPTTHNSNNPPTPKMPHIEVLQTATSTSAPGWAYVLDRAVDPSKIAINPLAATRNKNGRTQRAVATTSVTNNELSRREQLAIQRRLADLEKDGGGGKDILVPRDWRVGTGTDGGAGIWGKGRKMPTNVRRVLLSEKVFAHYLDDEEAKLHGAVVGGSGTVGGRRSDFGTTRGVGAGARRGSTAGLRRESVDVEMVDGASTEKEKEEKQEDEDKENPFFKVDVPKALSEEELESLLSAPPLSYNAARAKGLPESAPPQRKFCEMCGYWGRVKCLKCGVRVCGMDCKGQHDIDCRKRFA